MIMEKTDEWLGGLTGCKLRLAFQLRSKYKDFAVKGNAMPFIEELSNALGYKLVVVNLTSLEDLRGTPVIHKREKTGQLWFDYDIWWKNLIDKDATTLVLFNIDKAEDRLVNALKSFVENHGDDYFIGIITTDKNRDLTKTTTGNLLEPVIIWEED